MKTFALALALIATTVSSPMLAQSKLDFTLKNDTGLTIDQLFVSPNTSDDWEEDILGRDVLKQGESLDISFSRTEKSCLWDLRIIDEEDDAVEWEQLDLCKAEHITLMYKNGRATAIVK